MSRFDEIIERIRFDENGLVPAVCQDSSSGGVLMLAYVNAEALTLTLKTGLVHYYSRSRKKIWKKGETSGHVQRVHRVLIDCDADTVLFVVDQTVAACHEGYRTCFFREITSGEVEIVETRSFDPAKVYKT